MLPAQPGANAGAGDLAGRQQIALERITRGLAAADERARVAWRNYHVSQWLTIGLAALTPCLVALARDNPRNELFNWLSLFMPALAAVSAGVNQIFRWREDAVRFTTLAASIRSQLWRYQTRAGEYRATASDDEALATLVVRVDDLELKSVAAWSAAQLAEAPTPPADGPAGGSSKASGT
jgi:hypothetical protein